MQVLVVHHQQLEPGVEAHVSESQDIGPDDRAAGLADEADGLAERDPAVPPGGPGGLEKTLVRPAFQGGFAHADGGREVPGGEEALDHPTIEAHRSGPSTRMTSH